MHLTGMRAVVWGIPTVCSISRMAEDELDPGASTQMFQAFVDRPEDPASGSRWVPVALGVTALVIVAALAWLLLGG